MTTLPSGLPELIGDDEDLARFLVQSNQFNTTVAKPAAFLPSSHDRETSVSRHGTDPLERLWELGQLAVGNRKLYGAAILKAKAIRDVGLSVIADEPPDRHAAIRAWPWIENDLDLQKARQKEIALVLSSAAGSPILHAQMNEKPPT